MSIIVPQATVVITTKNRRDELRQAVESVIAQDVPLEILIIDDGSQDGTSEMIRSDFPTARLIRSEESRGLIAQRNAGAQLAATPIIISIDDDATFSSARVVSQTLTEFNDDRVGAVAIPFINVRQDNIVRQKAPHKDGIYLIDAFIGTAHAVRREVFLELGGYRDFLIHQGEEMDFCIRLLAAGYVVRLGMADPILHYESPRRDFRRMDYYGRRNDVLFSWHNIPMPEVLAHLPMNVINGLRSALHVRRYRHMVFGTAAGFGRMILHPGYRQPVSRQVYWFYRRLRKHSPVLLNEVETELCAKSLASKIAE